MAEKRTKLVVKL